MVELYGIVADIDNAEILTMISIILICVFFLYRVWKIAGLTGRRFTSWEWFQVYTFSITIFICGVVTFAKLLYPSNADQLLALLHLDGVLLLLAKTLQTVLLKIIRAMI